MNLPNQLSLFRIALVPIIILFLEIPGELTRFLALILFIIASFTDFLDGYIARKFNLITNLGKLIDPLADKILTLAVFVELTALGEVPAWVVILIISRELAISIFRAVAASAGVVIAAGWSGKFKTVFQMLAILMLLSNNYIGNLMNMRLDMIFVYISAVLALVSAFEYVYLNRSVLFESKEVPIEYEVVHQDDGRVQLTIDVKAKEESAMGNGAQDPMSERVASESAVPGGATSENAVQGSATSESGVFEDAGFENTTPETPISENRMTNFSDSQEIAENNENK